MLDRVSDVDMPELMDKLDDLADNTHMLSEWEIDFLESMMDWDGCFSKEQAKTIEKIYDKVF